MPVLLLIGALLALLFFIIWERRQPPKPFTREQMKKGWSPSVEMRWRVWLGLSLVAAVLALGYWLTPPTPPFTGRGSSIYRLLYEVWGGHGIAAAWSIGAVAFFAVAIADLHSGRKAGKR